MIIHPHLAPRAGSVELYLWSLCCAVMASYKERFTTIGSDAEDELVQVETGFVWLRTGASGRLVCENAVESLGSIKCGKFLDL